MSKPEEKESVEEHLHQAYDRSAATYDKIRWETTWGAYLKEAEDRRICQLLPVGPGDTVLDVAAGTGRASFALASRGAHILGVDQSENMLEKAEARRKELALANVQFQPGSADALQFPDDHFDAVMSIRFLHLIPKPMQRIYLAEMARVLKPGGYLLVEWSNVWDGLGYGILKNLYAHHVKGKKSRGTIFPHEVSGQLAGLRVDRKVGITFPGAGRLYRMSPALTHRLGDMGSVVPFTYLMNLLLVRAVKPGAKT